MSILLFNICLPLRQVEAYSVSNITLSGKLVGDRTDPSLETNKGISDIAGELTINILDEESWFVTVLILAKAYSFYADPYKSNIPGAVSLFAESRELTIEQFTIYPNEKILLIFNDEKMTKNSVIVLEGQIDPFSPLGNFVANGEYEKLPEIPVRLEEEVFGGRVGVAVDPNVAVEPQTEFGTTKKPPAESLPRLQTKSDYSSFYKVRRVEWLWLWWEWRVDGEVWIKAPDLVYESNDFWFRVEVKNTRERCRDLVNQGWTDTDTAWFVNQPGNLGKLTRVDLILERFHFNMSALYTFGTTEKDLIHGQAIIT
ncbi:MAG: hypothetical protein ACTSW4_03940 [Candidatus Ranarchaeia archaeon]